MEVQRCDHAAAFLDVVGAFLCQNEAAHNLLLGIAAGLQDAPASTHEPAPYLATIMAGARVVGAAVMTPPRGPVLSRVDDPAAVDLLARDLHQVYPTLPTVLGPHESVRPFIHAWRHLSGQSARLRVAQRVYQLETVIPVHGVPGHLRRATADDRPVLIAWMAAFAREALGEGDDRGTAQQEVDRRLKAPAPSTGLYVWHDGRPVSLIRYGGPTPHGIRIGPVYTPFPLRGQGYASAGVAAVSQLLLDVGRRWCFLFTDRANPMSNHIYQAIGYRPVCDVDEYAFEPPRPTRAPENMPGESA